MKTVTMVPLAVKTCRIVPNDFENLYLKVHSIGNRKAFGIQLYSSNERFIRFFSALLL
jgi:hypothetical protein